MVANDAVDVRLDPMADKLDVDDLRRDVAMLGEEDLNEGDDESEVIILCDCCRGECRYSGKVILKDNDNDSPISALITNHA